MNNRFFKTTALALVLGMGVASLSGCVVVIGGDEPDGVYWAGSNDHGATRADTELAGVIRDRIDSEPALKNADIHIYVDNADVLLKGNAPSGAAIDDAIRLAKGVDGVDEVTSKLTVDND